MNETTSPGSLTVLDANWPQQPFPTPENALTEPNGLVAVGGCLSPIRLLNAYRLGIFPWFNPGEPILWWAPDPRLVLYPSHLQISRSLRKVIGKQPFAVTYDRAFAAVTGACAEPRDGQVPDTWLTGAMRSAYLDLHHLGYAHSVEAWRQGYLVGGLYGVALGQIFFGESMFFREPNASKVAFVQLVKDLHRWGYQLIDCQVETAHLRRFGAELLDRAKFQQTLREVVSKAPAPCAWSGNNDAGIT
ncbi:MAG: leucyl/phenylalanyl-tRNA--protein transferase [Methylococcales bacterium]|nr:leucyl/phenylalanyl-tRNA--protein transferase [Methylococcales bacterium]